MRIVVGIADKGACGYYRLALPYGHLRDRGHNVSFVDDPGPELMNADVVVTSRQTDPEIASILEELTRIGKRVIYDMDDDVYSPLPSSPAATVYSTGRPATRTSDRIVGASDLVTVSTQPLADLYGRKSKLTPRVCQNAIDDDLFAEVQPQPDSSRTDVRIGWSGSNTHFADIATVVKPLTKIIRTYSYVSLNFLAVDYRGLFPADVRSRITFTEGVPPPQIAARSIGSHGEGLSVVPYYHRLLAQNWDIGIAPLISCTFNKSKSNIRLLEHGMCGIPTVASRFGPYRDYVEAGGPILTAADDREWFRHLSLLVEDREERDQIALANRRYVEKNHLLSQHLSEWEDALERATA